MDIFSFFLFFGSKSRHQVLRKEMNLPLQQEPTRRWRGGSQPPQDMLQEALATEEGKVGVEEYEPEPSAMEE